MTVRLVEAWNAAIVRLLEPVRESLRVDAGGQQR